MTPIRVIIGEDNPIFLLGLQGAVENDPSTELVGVARDRDSLLATAATVDVDVIVTDLRMPPAQMDEGLQVATRMAKVRSGVGVILLSQFADPSVALALLAGDAQRRGYLLKDRISDPRELIRAIERVAEGGTAVDPILVRTLLEVHGDRDPLAGLSPREREVLALIAEGLTNDAIAERLSVGESAVEKRIGSLFRKLPLGSPDQVHRRVSAALYYLDRSSLGSTPPAD